MARCRTHPRPLIKIEEGRDVPYQSLIKVWLAEKVGKAGDPR